MALCREAWPWIFGPSGDTLPNCTRPASPAKRTTYTHLCEGLQRLLAKIADGPDVRAVLADHSHASQMAFTGQRDLAARKHANAVGREQEADHQGGLTWWGISGFRLVGGSEAAYIQLRDGIQQEEHQIALGPLHCRALCLVPVTLRVPGPLRFPGLCTHPCSPRGEVTKDSQSAPSHHRLLAHQWQEPVGELVKCFFMDSLLALQRGFEMWCHAAPEPCVEGGQNAHTDRDRATDGCGDP